MNQARKRPGRHRRWGPASWSGLLGVCLALVLAGCGTSAASQGGSTGASQSSPATLDWRYYGNTLDGQRYQNVDQINPSNVSKLKPAWVFHTHVMNKYTSFESQPIVVNGTLYVSSPLDHVFAIDPATGALKWTYSPTDMPPLSKLAICCGQTNRGVAYGDGKIFLGRLDGTLVALSAKSGKQVWKTQVDPWQQKWTETMAPQFVDGKVIIGASGGEFEARGNVTAYDAKSGKQLWRFYIVPGSGQTGNGTWAGSSWKSGGGTIWSTPEVDPKLGLLYIHTGNAAPDLNGSQRAGKNLYTVSIVALDLKTGTMRWAFQEVHHDMWDYDATQPAQLYTVHVNGKSIPAIGNADKDGYYYILNRRTGKPIDAVDKVTEVKVPTSPAWQHPYPTQPESSISLTPQSINLPTKLMGKMLKLLKGENMKPAQLFTPPQQQPYVFQPGFETGPEVLPGAYSPRTHYAYIPAGGYEPWVLHTSRSSTDTLGSTGHGIKPPMFGKISYGLFDAVNTDTGKIAWRVKTKTKTVTGTAVAGNLVFFGESSGKFDAVNAKTGKVLWTFKVPTRYFGKPTQIKGVGGANGSPAVYVVNGKEYVVMDFGGNYRERADTVSGLSKVGDAVIAFALPSKGYTGPNTIQARPQPVKLGPPVQMFAPRTSPPKGAQVISLVTHDFHYFPDHFTVRAGKTVAIKLQVKGIEPAGIAVMMPSGPIALKGKVKPKHTAYFVFTAPSKPGTYQIYSPLAGGLMRFVGMTGTMTVR